MSLNIKDSEAHKLAQTLAKETGESMTEPERRFGRCDHDQQLYLPS